MCFLSQFLWFLFSLFVSMEIPSSLTLYVHLFGLTKSFYFFICHYCLHSQIFKVFSYFILVFIIIVVSLLHNNDDDDNNNRFFYFTIHCFFLLFNSMSPSSLSLILDFFWTNFFPGK